jgi:hypothetical protein
MHSWLLGGEGGKAGKRVGTDIFWRTNMKAIPRALTAALAACAMSLALFSGASVRAAAAPQATPVPSPMPNPAVTPAGNPVPTAPAPGTDMLNNNPNGNWLEKFNRTATPDPDMRPPSVTPLPPWCKSLMKPGVKLTAAQRTKLKTQCVR